MKRIAMFLPQFHDCPYNSTWWGSGFTEWNNVRAARPLFAGHHQPRVPADGYYDLSSAGEIARQAGQAREFGIGAFAIYHYWYEGKRPLGRPLDVILDNPDLKIDFSLCWANHSWTRSWKNRAGSLDVLIEQTYEKDRPSRKRHFEFLAKVFSDDRYTRIQGKPLFQIYLPEAIPECELVIEELREFLRERVGAEIHVSAMVTAWRPDWGYLRAFDSATLFQPSLALFSSVDLFGRGGLASDKFLESRLRAGPAWLRHILYRMQDMLPDRRSLYPYGSTLDKVLAQYEKARSTAPLPVFPMAVVDFDNTPRYGRRARLLDGFSAERFESQLRQLGSLALGNRAGDVLFVNAWNEWGEGMYLQPEGENDFSRLLAVRNSR